MKFIALSFLFSFICSGYELYSLDDMDKMVNRYNFFDPIKMKNHFDGIDIRLMKSKVSGGIDYFKQNYDVGRCYQGHFKCIPNGNKAFIVIKRIKSIYNDMGQPSEVFEVKFEGDKESVELKTSLSFSHSGGWSGRSLVESTYGIKKNYCYSKYISKVDHFDRKYKIDEALNCFKEQTNKIKERIPHFSLKDFEFTRTAAIGMDFLIKDKEMLCVRSLGIRVLSRLQSAQVDCPDTLKAKVESKAKVEK